MKKSQYKSLMCVHFHRKSGKTSRAYWDYHPADHLVEKRFRNGEFYKPAVV